MFTVANFKAASSIILMTVGITATAYYTVKGLKAYDKFIDNLASK